jgi:hypothetical protein
LTTWEQLKDTVFEGHINWRDVLDNRQRKEVEFSESYARDYGHGTTGHNALMLIAKMSEMLDAVQDNITFEATKE